MAKKIVWYARGGGIAKMGPYKSQIQATNALRLAKPTKLNTARILMGYTKAESNDLFPLDAFVWPEEV